MLSTEKTKRSLPKIIEPGNHTVKINSIKLYQPPFLEADKGYYLRLEIETEPINDDNFEGFLIDKDNAQKGRYKGQIGSVDVSKFPYKWKTKDGRDINRDQKIVNAINMICDAVETDWMPQHNNQFDTIEELVNMLNRDKPFKDKWLHVCIAGKGRLSPEGYTRYNLYLPDYKSIVALRNKETCTKFSESLHLEKPTGTIKPADPAKVEDFNNTPIPSELSNPAGSFELPPTELPSDDLPF